MGNARGFNNPIIILKLCDIIMLACVHACVFMCTCGFYFCVCVCVCGCGRVLACDLFIFWFLSCFVIDLYPLGVCVCVCVMMAGFNQVLCFAVLIALYESD